MHEGRKGRSLSRRLRNLHRRGGLCGAQFLAHAHAHGALKVPQSLQRVVIARQRVGPTHQVVRTRDKAVCGPPRRPALTIVRRGRCGWLSVVSARGAAGVLGAGGGGGGVRRRGQGGELSWARLAPPARLRRRRGVGGGQWRTRACYAPPGGRACTPGTSCGRRVGRERGFGNCGELRGKSAREGRDAAMRSNAHIRNPRRAPAAVHFVNGATTSCRDNNTLLRRSARARPPRGAGARTIVGAFEGPPERQKWRAPHGAAPTTRR